jgi:eukaryotic-like serine/threonine-protein kinase
MAMARQTVRLSLPAVFVAVLLAGCGGSQAVQGSSVTISVTAGHPETAVPSVIGETSHKAVRELHTSGFSVRERHRAVGGDSHSGIVLSQDPRRGKQADTGSTVEITVGR